MRSSIYAAFMLFAATACSKDGEPGSCYREQDNACVAYDRREAAAGKRVCSGMKWTAGEKSCPVTSRLGTCSKKSSFEYLYGGAPNNYSASSAKNACEHAGGVFTPAPTGPGTSP